MKKNPAVDTYIARAQPFARPILEKVRAAFHKGCPELEEKIKWGVPSFEYKGMMGGMAAFKAHVAWGVWRQKELPDPHGLFKGRAMMGGDKISDAAQLPAEKVIIEYVQAAARLNDAGPAKRAPSKPKKPPKAPADLLAALKKSPKALATFEAFPPSHKREYIEWIVEARQAETRARRLAQAVEWMAQGKPRNWKYMKC
jgi:uncharacterized protein YdeI (YjbR/CyaY-like superfamily)